MDIVYLAMIHFSMNFRKGKDEPVALEDPVITKIAKKYKKSPAHVRVKLSTTCK